MENSKALFENLKYNAQRPRNRLFERPRMIWKMYGDVWVLPALSSRISFHSPVRSSGVHTAICTAVHKDTFLPSF